MQTKEAKGPPKQLAMKTNVAKKNLGEVSEIERLCLPDLNRTSREDKLSMKK